MIVMRFPDAGPVRAHLRPTTFVQSERLDDALGLSVLLVSEAFQHTGSFKFRAAMSAALARDAPHLVTASSGNFGAALARAARETKKRCTVVMPETSAAVKIAHVRSYGAAVDLIDVTKVTREARVTEIVARHPEMARVSPYDDDWVIAGNSTLGDEIFEREVPDVLVVPIGGGGLSSGIVVARDRRAARTEIVGAEPLLGNDAARSLAAGTIVANAQEPPTIADGARTLSLGTRNFEVLRSGLAGIVEVSEDAIVRGLRLLFAAANMLVEPTGALAVAALLADPARFAGRRVACVVSGGNVDPALYGRLMLD
jgi:threonine dehydratase